jgi:hypothetical protein
MQLVLNMNVMNPVNLPGRILIHHAGDKKNKL